ncbi:hypothetical protein ADLECEL_18640 [Adlercreutzia equolifaciens subsp. celatus]|nr:hypothetical protein ADLECEL_18640 [Adlercreutzia equolifaciens subsp. celatus]
MTPADYRLQHLQSITPIEGRGGCGILMDAILLTSLSTLPGSTTPMGGHERSRRTLPVMLRSGMSEESFTLAQAVVPVAQGIICAFRNG